MALSLATTNIEKSKKKKHSSRLHALQNQLFFTIFMIDGWTR